MRLSAQAYEQAMAHCAASLPDEGCGVFIGEGDVIASFQPLRNISSKPRTSFTLDPQEWIPLLYASDRKIIGLLHSHPNGAAVPSAADRQLQWPDFPSYWIASFRLRHLPELVCYRMQRSFTLTTGEASIQFHPMSYTIAT